VQQAPGRRRFLDLAAAQHDDAVGHLRDHRQVVRDVHRRRTRMRTTSRNARSTSIWVVTSSAVVGSSRITRAGSVMKAMAAITRCNWPPETWCG
jgi:hypothetical protein